MKIVCENIGKSFHKAEVLKQINLSLEPGKIYGLWGKNGSGKTMLMRVMAGLVSPTTGRVLVDGVELKKGFPPNMGLLLENPSFLDGYTAMGNLRLLAGIRNKISEEQIRSTLQKLGLDPDDKRVYRKFSLGMRQRLGIACAIMEEPDFILLDEPINALDTNGVKQVRKVLEEEKNRGALVVISCHDADEMRALADEVFMLEDGRIVKRIMLPEEWTS